MLVIKHNAERPSADGQYRVELVDTDPYGMAANRLGYWCDKTHLLTMLDALLGQLTQEEITQRLHRFKNFGGDLALMQSVAQALRQQAGYLEEQLKKHRTEGGP